MSASVTNIVANPSVLSASVGDRVWLDADGDGSQDIGEPGIANVEVTLKDQLGRPWPRPLTDVNGRYLFSGVTAGHRLLRRGDATRLPSGSRSPSRGYTNNRTTAFDLAGWAELHRRGPGLQARRGDRRPSGTWSGWTPTTTACATRARSASAASPSSSTGTPTATAWCDDGVDTLRGDDDERSRRQLSLHGRDGAGSELHRDRRPRPSRPRRPSTRPTTATFRSYPDVSRRRRLPECRLRLPGHRCHHLHDPGPRLAGRRTATGSSGGEIGIAGVTVELLTRASRSSARPRRPRTARSRSAASPGGGADYTTPQRHGGRPHRLLRHHQLRPGAAARREQPDRQRRPHGGRRLRQLRLPGLARDRRHDLLRHQRQRDPGRGRERDRRRRREPLPGHQRRRGHRRGRAAGGRQRHDGRQRPVPLRRASPTATTS